MGRQALGTRMVYRETLLEIQQRLPQHLIRRSWIHGVIYIYIYISEHTSPHVMAKWMGSPRHVTNRRRRTREGPELACAQAPLVMGWHMQREKDELTSCRGTVQSAWQKPPVRRKGGRAGLPKMGKWPPRGTGTTVLTSPGSATR